MPIRWPARLGLVSLGVLALAACNRSDDAQPTTGASGAPAEAEALPVEPIGASEAAEPLAPAASPAAAQASPEVADARAFDTGITNAAANSVEAYRYDQGGQSVRVWNDPRMGSRIVTPGPDGFVISYFRAGATNPYLLRSGDRFYVLSGGRVVRVLDTRGRVIVIRDDDRPRWDEVIRRSGDARREAERRRASYVRAVRADREADKAAGTAQEAARDANQAAGRADREADRAKDAAKDAREARREADTPAERRDAQAAIREANQAKGQAERAADRAQEASDKARAARREAVEDRREAQAALAALRARCDRQRARGEKLDANCPK